MTGLLRPQRRWKRVHGGWQTVMRRCPDCCALIVEGDSWEHEQHHLMLDRLADLIEARQPGAAVPDDAAGIELAEPGQHEPTWDERMPRYESWAARWAAAIVRADQAMCRAFAAAWLAAFPRRTAPAELPPATIPAPPPVPVPGYVAEQARRQRERTALLSKRQES